MNQQIADHQPRTPIHRRFGPGLFITAAFIGPGTVVTASQAGAQFGCSLLWTILLAVIGAIILQSFAARLGVVSRTGLGEAIREVLRQSPWLRVAIALMVAALGVGNAAYQTGNLTGAAVGIASVVGGSVSIWAIALAVATAVLLFQGRFQVLKGILVALVLLLSVAFIATAATSLPDLARIGSGWYLPRLNSENITLALALVGTTIVPYNLFLHASSAADNWREFPRAQALRDARTDTVLAISLGGMVTAAVLLTANAAFFERGVSLTQTSAIADQLRPTLGDWSGSAFALGLFAAGLTSSITAPLATAYALSGCFGWKAELSSWRFRAIALSVVGIGALMAAVFGSSPSQTIIFAQVANGLLLPVVAMFLLFAVGRVRHRQVNDLSLLGKLAGWAVAVGVLALGAWRVVLAFL